MISSLKPRYSHMEVTHIVAVSFTLVKLLQVPHMFSLHRFKEVTTKAWRGISLPYLLCLGSA